MRNGGRTHPTPCTCPPRHPPTRLPQPHPAHPAPHMPQPSRCPQSPESTNTATLRPCLQHATTCNDLPLVRAAVHSPHHNSHNQPHVHAGGVQQTPAPSQSRCRQRRAPPLHHRGGMWRNVEATDGSIPMRRCGGWRRRCALRACPSLPRAQPEPGRGWGR
jgi:hypothetical protein